MISNTDQPHLLVLETEHDELAVDSLLQFHRNQPRIQAFVRAVAAGVQCLEDQTFEIVTSSLITEGTPLNLLEKWAAIVGGQRGALTKAELYRFVCHRIGANTIGTVLNPATVDEYIGLLVDAFAPSSVLALFFVNGVSVIEVFVGSTPSLPEALAQRGATIARDAALIGALVVVQEYDADNGLLFDTPGRGLDGPTLGTTLYDGFRSDRS